MTYESRKKLVEQIIAKELLLEKSEDGASSDGSKTHDFEELKIQYLYQVMHQEEVDANLKEPTEEEIAKYYEENKELLTTPATVELSMIWIDQGTNGEKKEQALTKANEALASVRDGEDFAEVAKSIRRILLHLPVGSFLVPSIKVICAGNIRCCFFSEKGGI